MLGGMSMPRPLPARRGIAVTVRAMADVKRSPRFSRKPARGGGGRGAGRGPASGEGGASIPWPRDGAYRVFGVQVPLELDPGKDDVGVHEPLRAAVARRLGCGAPDALSLNSLTLVRKSFDARRGKPKAFAYVVDVPVRAARAARANRSMLSAAPGQLELLLADACSAAADDAVAVAVARDGGATTSTLDAAAADGVDVNNNDDGLVARRLPANFRPLHASTAARGGPVIVVGAGPAGLFAALAAAEAGLPVVLLERGQPVEVRGRDIGALFVRRRLNPDSNLCYGEGGAGTWSDGKLTTRIGRNSDPVRRVLRALHDFGAPDSVLVAGKPHLGTDRLVRILKAFRQHLIALGVQVRFGETVTDLIVDDATGAVAGVELCGGAERLRGSAVVLAVGHSARPLYKVLARRGVELQPKPFALGFRVEHPQAWLDAARYGTADAAGVMRGKGRLPVADYTLAAEVMMMAPDAAGAAAAGAADDRASAAAAAGEGVSTTAAASSKRGVYSFCMCPGGQIVPTPTSDGELAINGMSFSRRNSAWANAALVTAVGPDDWAHHAAEHGALAGLALQLDAERAAAELGGGGHVAPVQRVPDFLAGRDLPPGAVLPSSSYRLGVRPARLDLLYSPSITAALRAALLKFERSLPGFASEHALLHGAETRTSAPVQITRGRDTLQSVSMPRLYPAGEGAGYAGGIVSAAVDGLRIGEALIAALLGAESGGGGGSELASAPSRY